MSRKKLHVLFLNSWYPSRVLPTNGDFIQRHAEAVALYHEVTAMHVISDPRIDDKNTVVDEFTKNGVHTLIAYLPKSSNPFSKWFRYVRAFLKLIRRVKSYDIIHLNHIYPAGLVTLLLSIFRNKKYIISEHWTFYHEGFTQMIKPIERWISKLVTRQADFICPVSDELAESMKSFGLKGNYISVPNVVDTQLFKPNYKSTPKMQLLHVSNMNEMQKNISGILNVISRLSKEKFPFHFFMIGNNAEDFQAKVEELEIPLTNITLINHIQHQELVKFFQESDAFILFSDDENLPCVILESFSCGTPVISTDVGGIAEFFPGNFGRLIPRSDEEALYKAILDIYKKEHLANREVMHEYSERNFSPPSIATRFTDIYHKALKD